MLAVTRQQAAAKVRAMRAITVERGAGEHEATTANDLAGRLIAKHGLQPHEYQPLPERQPRPMPMPGPFPFGGMTPGVVFTFATTTTGNGAVWTKASSGTAWIRFG